MSNKIKQINKEAIITLLLYFFYFLWWYYFAFIYSEKNNKFILGFPAWFFYSCILGFFIINLVLVIVIKFLFKEIELE